MRVEVRLHATLVEHVAGARAGEPRSVDLEPDATLGDLLERVGIPPENVHLAIVNGKAEGDLSTRLTENDRVGLFPPVGGG